MRVENGDKNQAGKARQSSAIYNIMIKSLDSFPHAHAQWVIGSVVINVVTIKVARSRDLGT